MIRRDEVRISVTLVGLTPCEPPIITISRAARRPDGKQRTIVQKLDVAPNLYARIASEVCEGDEIEVTIITEWHKNRYSPRFCDFRRGEIQTSETSQVA